MENDIFYRRPLSRIEALRVLGNLGIETVTSIVQTYISGYPGTGYDPVGPCQVVAALVRSETGSAGARHAEVHFCLRLTEAGWEIAAARRAWTL